MVSQFPTPRAGPDLPKAYLLYSRPRNPVLVGNGVPTNPGPGLIRFRDSKVSATSIIIMINEASFDIDVTKAGFQLYLFARSDFVKHS